MTNVRRALLEDAAEFYEGFLDQKSDDPEIREEMGRAYQRLGFSYEFLGRYKKAVEVTRGALDIYERLIAKYPATLSYYDGLCTSYNTLAVRLTRGGHAEEAVATSKTYMELTEKLAHEHPTVPNFRRRAARAPVELVNQMGSSPGPIEERVELCRQSLARWEQFRRDFPNLEIQPDEEGHTHHWLGSNLMKLGRFEEAEAHSAAFSGDPHATA